MPRTIIRTVTMHASSPPKAFQKAQNSFKNLFLLQNYGKTPANMFLRAVDTGNRSHTRTALSSSEVIKKLQTLPGPYFVAMILMQDMQNIFCINNRKTASAWHFKRDP